jgi:Protein of unknown function (DUF3551)
LFVRHYQNASKSSSQPGTASIRAFNGLSKRKNKMTKILGMMTAPAAAFAVMALVGFAAPAAHAGEFCMTDSSGMRGCGYSSLEQCQASASGKNGSCARDPYFETASVTKPTTRNALAYSPKPAHHHHAAQAVAH